MTEETNTTELPDIFHEIPNSSRHFPQHFGFSMVCGYWLLVLKVERKIITQKQTRQKVVK